MGLYDTVLFVDRIDAVRCPLGHPLRRFQTKDMTEPSLQTYFVHHGRLYLAVPADAGLSDDSSDDDLLNDAAGVRIESSAVRASGIESKRLDGNRVDRNDIDQSDIDQSDVEANGRESSSREGHPLAGDVFTGKAAVHEHRFELHEVRERMSIRLYGSCKACLPVLVRRAEPGFLGDIVIEHGVFVDFRLTLRPGEPIAIERISGSRDDLKNDLRARGVYVLDDDEPLALAHREIKSARSSARARPPRR